MNLDNLRKKISPTSLSKPVVAISLEIIAGVILSFSSLFIFLKIAREVLEQEFLQFDLTVSKAVYSLRSPELTRIMLAITSLGSGFVLTGLSLIGIIFTWKKKKRQTILVSSVLLMGVGLNLLLKQITHVPRPQIDPLLDLTSSYSFPSGHSMNSFIFYSLLAYIIPHITKNKPIRLIVPVFAVILIFLIGFSRIYLGVHNPSDVVAGFIAGFWVFTTAILIRKTVTFFRLFRKPKTLS